MTFHFRVRDGNGWGHHALTTKRKILSCSRNTQIGSLPDRKGQGRRYAAATKSSYDARSYNAPPVTHANQQKLVAGVGFEPTTFGL
jgi:hypothetical protein